MTSVKFDLIAVVGPTGSGKSALAMRLAAALRGEIISCDSVQVYRGFDIGSAKPTLAEQKQIPHHLIDVVEWDQDFDAAIYADLAAKAIRDVRARGCVPIVTGGTGLYLRALLSEKWSVNLPKDEQLRTKLQMQPADELYRQLLKMDPVRASQLHPNDKFRVSRAIELVTLTRRPIHEIEEEKTSSEFHPYIIMIEPPRGDLHVKIASRANLMLESGLIFEVEKLFANGVAKDCKPMQSIGYRQVADFLQGSISNDKLKDSIVAATRQYAKRQITWFKKVAVNVKLGEWSAPDLFEQLHKDGVF
jgi:tRNA dimethylallyltransferase